MKYFNFLLLALLIISCSAEDNALDCKEVKYEEEFSARLGDMICFPDGNGFEIKTITDQFCCCQCVCIWEGELRVMVETTLEDGTKDLFEFGSGTYVNDFTEDVFPGYRVENFRFLYDGKMDALPLCDEEYKAENVDLSITIRPK